MSKNLRVTEAITCEFLSSSFTCLGATSPPISLWKVQSDHKLLQASLINDSWAKVTQRKILHSRPGFLFSSSSLNNVF